jgi:hypothetical protein
MADLKSVSVADIKRVANEYLVDEKAWRAVMRRRPDLSPVTASHADPGP